MLTRKLADILAILASCSLAYKLRFGELLMAPEYQVPTLAFMVLAHVCLSSLGYYDRSSTSGATDKLFIPVYALAIAALLTAFFLYLSKSGADFSRLWFLLMLSLSMFLIVVIWGLFQHASNRIEDRVNIVLLGPKEISERLETKGFKLNLVKTFSQNVDDDSTNLEMLRCVEDFIDARRNHEDGAISEVWITQEIYSRFTIQELLLEFGRCSVNIVFVTNLLELPEDGFTVANVNGFVTANSSVNRSKGYELILKSIFDRSIALVLILCLFPLMVLIALLIKLDSNGPVLYRQHRYGLHGNEFEIWKFRTMSVSETTAEFTQASQDDPRITRIGHFLRRTSLDELPQLINVVFGSMSLVGPRPHPNLLNEKFKPLVDRYMTRHIMKPGITGLAQISGSRGETPQTEDMNQRVLLDLEYINNWSFKRDLMILFKTIAVILGRTNQ